ncbi:uncharacterized protein LOC106637677 [Copidosoma floridanum]|uniref:uncharacterized protein LOC106637677 n=1 Tax=Copidosoma floridanum TaxID=29053 RepID=UPI0006C9966E|nr:uncharacterized protein LOC106637677 [Copidosoma floridanum]
MSQEIQVKGTTWIQGLNKDQLVALCIENDIESSSDKVDELRALLREFVKNKLDQNNTTTIKGLKTTQSNENITGTNTSEVQSENGAISVIKKMEVTGNLDFDIKKDDWEQYVDRMEQFFIANDVTDTSKQRAILLSKVGAEMYDVIAKVCKPHKPGAKSYDEIIKLVKKHLKPQASHLAYRSNFGQRVQKDNESISDYVAELKDLANDCKFNNLEDQVLDQLISGLKNKSVVAELLKIDEPTLEVALKKALATEAANKGAEKLQEASSKKFNDEFHKLNIASKNSRGNRGGFGRGKDNKQYRGRSREQGQQYQHQSGQTSSGAMQRPALKPATHAGYTMDCYCCADITLMNHDESLYEPVGMLKRVKVEANGNTIWTDVYVTKSKGPAIIGRPWLKALGMWPLYKNLKINSMETEASITEKLKAILHKHEAFFSPGHGSFTKALKKDVENEIDRLVGLGKSVPVDKSEWATPIVPILKPNGKLRMCADFKVTVNPQLVTMRYSAPNFDHAIAKLQGGAKYTKTDCTDAYLQILALAQPQVFFKN